MNTEYRIEYSIQRCVDPDQDEEFVEIGFGSSGAWGDIDSASFAIGTNIQLRTWETESGMPDPQEAK